MLADDRISPARPGTDPSISRRGIIGGAAALLAAGTIAPRAFATAAPRPTALDQYVTLGRSGLRVSPFALGTMTFGEDLGWGASVTESVSILDRYVGMGGNFLDTANGYTNGHSEKIIGDHLARDRGRRQRLVIGTKFAANMFPGDPNGGGTSRKAVIASCDESLRRLQTDYIDLYWMHHWDRFTPIEETMSALDDLVRVGKVRYIGVSDTPAWKAAQAQMIARREGWSPFIATQVEYSLGERTVEGEIIPMAEEMDMAVMPWAPLAAGRISGKYTRVNRGQVRDGRAVTQAARVTEKHYEIVDALAGIAQRNGTTIPRVALAWIQNRPGVTATITGNRLLSQFEDNVQALGLQLPEADIAALDRLTEPDLDFPTPFLRENAASLHQAGTTVNGRPSRSRSSGSGTPTRY